MLQRAFQDLLKRQLSLFPVVTILGARQCGKTTFVKHNLPGWRYVDCELPSDAAPLEADPEGRLRQLGGKVVLDEANTLPQMFPVLRGLVDEKREERGRFVLLDSASPQLIRTVSESLAGRTGLVELTPFLLPEVCGSGEVDEIIRRLWFRGGLPDAFLIDHDSSLTLYYDAYVRTFIERDLVRMGIEVSPQTMRKLWAMLAHANGQQWNASLIASSLGVNYQTVNRYVGILEQAFLVRRLQPYYANVGKRLTKSPKIMQRHTGLLHFFLGISSQETLDVSPARGASWESFVTEQLIALAQLAAPACQPYYWRTHAGAEVDLLMDTGSSLVPFEIKLHSAPDKQMTRGLTSCMSDLGIDRGYIVNPGSDVYPLGNSCTVIGLARLVERLPDILAGRAAL